MSVPRLLLLSNSTNPGQDYLSHATDWLADFLGPGPGTICFVPFAGVTIEWDDYTARVAQRFAPLGWTVAGLHREADGAAALSRADAVAVGGGNTFHLLHAVRDRGLLDPLRRVVAAGRPYIGWSAGSNLACPTIGTTNDMPIVDPGGHQALGLIPCQLNPHFTEATLPRHGGESRRQRLAEFLAANPRSTIVCLPEGTALCREGKRLRLIGPHAALLLRHGEESVSIPAGGEVSHLLN